MEFKLEFKMDNAIFDDKPKMEAARLLHEIGSLIYQGATNGRVIELNGNTIGKWEIRQ